jgi:hypothetical protein
MAAAVGENIGATDLHDFYRLLLFCADSICRQK